LNGAVTFTFGAVESVDPVTATLPAVPGSVHSGASTFCGAAVGHAFTAGAGSVTSDEAALTTECGLADGVSVLEPHAASVTASDAAQAASATERDARGEFTVATLQPLRGPTEIGRFPGIFSCCVLVFNGQAFVVAYLAIGQLGKR
jgi:hypothetical protein